MKFTEKWLREQINTQLDSEQISKTLTMAGLEVDAMERLGKGLDKVQVGFLEAVQPHPDADRLTCCQVRVGETRLNIVCGATNHKQGDKVAVARDGAELPNGLKIKKGQLRGQPSEGMLCSLTELGMAESSEGIIILPSDAPEGATMADYFQRNDICFELGITPNRGDCLGVRGIARDLAAVTGESLIPLQSAVQVAANVPTVAVEIADGEGCPRYAGRVVEGVKVGPSPDWLRNRLESVGLRSINNIVDITNYVMLELNQPMHAFDLAQLAAPIVVRRANPDERLTTLDYVERQLTEQMTLICDQQRPLAVAGVMGGLNSGVTDATTSIFLESAYFNPVRTARTGRRLNLVTDSRHRFERGTDPMAIELALDRATQLVLELCGGQAGAITLTDAGTWSRNPPVAFRHTRANALTGMCLTQAEQARYLQAIGCVEVAKPAQSATVEGAVWYLPPTHRHDLLREEDLVEEVVRLFGYDKVPTELPSGAVATHQDSPERQLAKRLRKALTGLGYLEAVNYAFVAPEVQARFDADLHPIMLTNPLSEEQSCMRTSLIAGLVEAVRRNLSRGNDGLRLFEMGHIFKLDAQGQVQEEEHVSMVLAGRGTPRIWHTPQRVWDFFDLKGDFQTVVSRLQGAEPRYLPGGPAFLHPGRKAEIHLRGRVAGWMGELHPSLREAMGIDQPVLMLELRSDALTQVNKKEAANVSRYPAVTRDFAFVVDRDTPAATILESARSVAKQLVREVELFDLYTGEHVPQDKKSIAFGLVLQADDRTLDEGEINQVMAQVTAKLEKQFNAVLRA
ncbi:phenylalanyl-tRNA synthetase beta subunit [Magnetococcus marinus MC-1]|uniref:Phenylalanine--tRNA ligase beta subunit n=1 Tax=Magnetococcus marinus (strain ATCC BAA-1437 / JCM 17883 / MC-1) TaxID=156889 RepID=A0L4K1_MAGMM|nr:phenylalanine--tRNA ligase subunit beta [Magnetococcus marinus]ABK42894.1 phenylalanyl-tRNA synthetase beta subunit [Magnetococcus marinus MC-1]